VNGLSDTEKDRVSNGARVRLLRAALTEAGERGYENVTVQHVIDRAGVHRSLFYNVFHNKTECMVEAFITECDRVEGRLLKAIEGAKRREGGCDAMTKAGLAELVDYVDREPAFARALLLEWQTAGPSVREKRESMKRSFSRALTASRDLSSSHTPPRVMADRILGGIEVILQSELAQPRSLRDLSDLLPELRKFVAVSADC
jgi:AcrR family transcriptional regulator